MYTSQYSSESASFKRLILKLSALLALALIVSFNCYASLQDPIFTVTTPNITKKFTRSQLLEMPTLRHIQMTNSRAYPGININFAAIKLCDILKPLNISSKATLEFISSDHFYALVPAHYVLNCSDQHSLAYLAIETEDKPWPRLHYNNADKNNPSKTSAGPFQVIWLNPEKSYISNEYWTWNLIEVKEVSLRDANTVIPPPSVKDAHISNGYSMYVSRCSGCHTMNGVGKGKIGPDLNIPLNAVKRFKDDNQLKQFIRDPQSVRPKKNDRMSGTNEESLSNQDLNDLVLYFHYMDQHK
jgi:cytochrome c2